MTYPRFDPNPHAPRKPLPRGSWDCQVHVFGDPQRYPLRSGRAYEPPANATIEAACAMHQAIGIDYGVVTQSTAHGTDHRILLDAIGGRPNYYGIALVDDTVSDKELQRLHDCGVRGARFNFWSKLNIAPTAEQFLRAIERIGPMGWHVRIHSAGREWLDIRDLMTKVMIPAVIDHMGHMEAHDSIDQPGFLFLLELLRRDNWWIMVSNGDRCSSTDAPWDDIVPFGQRLIAAAPDRAVWCTDWPHVFYLKEKMCNDGDLVDLLDRYAPDEALRRKVMVDNPARLFGLKN
jgi:2-pyrone-4,6-dicarboxylate lactonase